VTKQTLIVIPGLSDNIQFTRWLVSHIGVEFEVFTMNWLNPDNDFDEKLTSLIKRIDQLNKDRHQVSLLGISAGGSLVLNALVLRQKSIHRVVNVCGRLRKGDNAYLTLNSAARKSRSFKQSVLAFERNEESLSKKSRGKVLTLRPLYDEVVPTSTVSLTGAKNIRIFSVEHLLSIVVAHTIYLNTIRRFLS
jgi:hypothetical protein